MRSSAHSSWPLILLRRQNGRSAHPSSKVTILRTSRPHGPLHTLSSLDGDADSERPNFVIRRIPRVLPSALSRTNFHHLPVPHKSNIVCEGATSSLTSFEDLLPLPAGLGIKAVLPREQATQVHSSSTPVLSSFIVIVDMASSIPNLDVSHLFKVDGLVAVITGGGSGKCEHQLYTHAPYRDALNSHPHEAWEP